jgi:hypothetical protein
MRKFLAISLLFLMSIRGFVGDAMAYEMLLSDQKSTPSAQVQLVDTEPNAKAETEHFPCHMDSASPVYAESDLSQCTTCQVCHLSAVLYSNDAVALTLSCNAAPTQALAIWHSADLKRPAKTPVL